MFEPFILPTLFLCVVAMVVWGAIDNHLRDREGVAAREAAEHEEFHRKLAEAKSARRR